MGSNKILSIFNDINNSELSVTSLQSIFSIKERLIIDDTTKRVECNTSIDDIKECFFRFENKKIDRITMILNNDISIETFKPFYKKKKVFYSHYDDIFHYTLYDSLNTIKITKVNLVGELEAQIYFFQIYFYF